MVEIGTFMGLSACFLASSIKGTLYTINVSASEMKIAQKTVSDFGLTNVKFIVGDSLEALPELVQNIPNLEAAYIDGYHSYRYSMGEYQIIEPLVGNKKSAIFIDDAHKPHPDGEQDGGILRTVDEPGSKRIPILGNRIAVKTFGDFALL